MTAAAVEPLVTLLNGKRLYVLRWWTMAYGGTLGIVLRVEPLERTWKAYIGTGMQTVAPHPESDAMAIYTMGSRLEPEIAAPLAGDLISGLEHTP